MTREQKVGERNWDMALLQRLAEAEGASGRGLTASPPAAAAPAAAAPAAEEIVRSTNR